eukprot:TRINITY_DN7437_c0_g1_i1.p2 TRINITY_DN7437_c0_g1~~TRINITY_DN7437_c0_g1_i1.p2  ORF type:complete len:231 (+),score=-14.53 TRINITY_DN7437_c0_g1_i1:938-1630(+)
MAALLFVADLILDLERARPRLDHLPREQIRRLGIAEAGVDIGDDRHDMRLVIVDRLHQPLRLDCVARIARMVEIAEQQAQLAGIRLPQERVQLLDQRRHARLLMHRLVGQRPEIAAQRRDHPARQVQIALVGGAEVLLDADHLLLADEAVPAAQRLRVGSRIGVIGRHVAAHDPGGVARDVEPGLKPVLKAHARDRLSVDPAPGRLRTDGLAGGADLLLVGHVHVLTLYE